MDVQELIQRSHQIAIAKGWWPEGETHSVCEQAINFHAEVSEAWEEWRVGRINLWWSHESGASLHAGDSGYDNAHERTITNGWKPEGFWVEIADLCIRLGDTMGAYGWTGELFELAAITSLPLLIHRLHTYVTDLTAADVPDWHMSASAQANIILSTCVSSAGHFGVDLLALCELKITYNETRPIRHGGKKA